MIKMKFFLSTQKKKKRNKTKSIFFCNEIRISLVLDPLGHFQVMPRICNAAENASIFCMCNLYPFGTVFFFILFSFLRGKRKPLLLFAFVASHIKRSAM